MIDGRQSMQSSDFLPTVGRHKDRVRVALSHMTMVAKRRTDCKKTKIANISDTNGPKLAVFARFARTTVISDCQWVPGGGALAGQLCTDA